MARDAQTGGTVSYTHLTVLQAINRQIAHYTYHTGQIVFLAKHIRSSKWKTLSIPRGKSEDYLSLIHI